MQYKDKKEKNQNIILAQSCKRFVVKKWTYIAWISTRNSIFGGYPKSSITWQNQWSKSIQHTHIWFWIWLFQHLFLFLHAMWKEQEIIFILHAPLGYDKKKKHIIHVARSIKLQTSNMKSLMWLQNTCCSGLLKHS